VNGQNKYKVNNHDQETKVQNGMPRSHTRLDQDKILSSISESPSICSVVAIHTLNCA
jgi:hypothetical protein